ncbi:MAG: DUF1513 domain-containing protein [Myxococcota bacterium]
MSSSLGLACGHERLPAPHSALWISGQGRENAELGLVVAASTSSRASEYRSGFRGHDVAIDPSRPGRVVLFGRRPGRESIVVDIRQERVEKRLSAHEGHAFQGHGFFTPDGCWLVAVEADLNSAHGKLVVRDGTQLNIIEVHDTYGLGPHEAALLPDTQTVVIANGGLLTRAETGREVLNLATMDSTLVYVHLGSGDLLQMHRVDEPRASIRHLDILADGTVALGLQIQRAAIGHNAPLPLCGRHRGDEEIVLFDDRLDVTAALNDYVGSVAVSSAARIAAYSSPRGNLCAAWSIDDGRFIGMHELYDGCGLAASLDDKNFIFNSSTGEVRTLRVSDLAEIRSARRKLDVQWDNHLVIVDAKGWS